MKPLILVFFALIVLAFSAAPTPSYAQHDRGKYIYDDVSRLPLETELSIASYLWKLDSKTGYELVIVFPKEVLTTDQVIAQYNKMGVGKKGKDNGAALFIFPDNTAFMAIGSGNDKISVSYTKTEGEAIMSGLKADTPLTLLRFASKLSGKLDASDENVVSKISHPLVDNWQVVLLWGAFFAFLAFAISQWDGFQDTDLIYPAVVVFVLLVAFGIDAVVGSGGPPSHYSTFGVQTSERHSTYDWVQTVTICTGGKTPVCTTSYIDHTDYINDVSFRTYENTDYKWRFTTTDGRGAWNHVVGDTDELTLEIKNKALSNASYVSDNSGGKTIGDGVWIYAGATK